MDKLEELEKKIQELEKKVNQSNNMFGRSYSQVGNSDQDFLIKTRGQLKVQYGNKFIDLLKNGKINVDSRIIQVVDSADQIDSTDGIYFIKSDESVFISVSGQLYPLAGATDEIFVSYSPQESQPEEKQQALINLGLICEDISNVSVQNGMVYNIADNKIYLIKNGIATEFTSDIPSIINKQLTIKQNGQGALILSGTLKSNGLNFGNSWLYENGGIILEGDSLKVISGIDELLKVDSRGITTDSVTSNHIKSSDYTEFTGFELRDGVLTLDKVIERNPEENITDTYTYFIKTLIVSSSYQEGLIYKLTVKQCDIFPGDIVLLSNGIKEYQAIVLPKEEQEEELEDGTMYITIKFDEEPDPDEFQKTLYVIERNGEKALYIKNNSIEFDGLFIGYRDGSFKSILPNAQYPDTFELDKNDSSKKFASTEWVQSLLPVSTIVAFNGTVPPEGWALCNGQNGTPNLPNIQENVIYIMKIS